MNIKSLKRALKQSHIISTAFYYGRQCAAHRSAGKRGSDVIVHQSPNAPCRMRVAVICDEMTWRNCISVFSETFFLTPNNWKDTLHTYKPQLLFCESAWEGIDAYRYIWCGGIFRNHRVLYEHRGALLGILKDCREAQIPTVFWNKEDPAYFGDPLCDFTDTALRFDHIFTTAEECVEAYRARGHKSVHVMPFGFSPRLFHPLGRNARAEGAVFTGSWFPENAQRCADVRRVFDYLKQQRIPLTIFDRQMSPGGRSSFPAEYLGMVQPALPYEKMGEVYRTFSIGVNVNTVKESRSMFARRVYEMMACALPIVSNASTGLKKRFGDRIAFAGEENTRIPTDETAHELLREVFLCDTFDSRMQQMLEVIGLDAQSTMPEVDVFCVGSEAKERFDRIDWPAKRLIPVQDEAELKTAISRMSGDYGIILNAQSACPDIRFYMTQFAFLPQSCGVGSAGRRYAVETTAEYVDTLWPRMTLTENLLGEKLRYTA